MQHAGAQHGAIAKHLPDIFRRLHPDAHAAAASPGERIRVNIGIGADRRQDGNGISHRDLLLVEINQLRGSEVGEHLGKGFRRHRAGLRPDDNGVNRHIFPAGIDLRAQ